MIFFSEKHPLGGLGLHIITTGNKFRCNQNSGYFSSKTNSKAKSSGNPESHLPVKYASLTSIKQSHLLEIITDTIVS